MNTVIKYLLYLLVLLLLVSWLVTVGKSCGQTPKTTSEQKNTQEVVEESSQELMEELEEKDFSEELESILDEEEATSSDELDYSSYDPSKDKPAEEETEMASSTQNTSKSSSNQSAKEESEPTKENPPTTRPSASSGGNYLVVAGSYIVPGNANRMKTRLSAMGYSSEVVNFDLSEYHAVLAGRYPDYDAAQRVVNILSGKGIDSYVKKRSF